MSHLILVIGGTGEGKTTYARSLCVGKKHIAVDYSDDFKGYTRYTAVHAPEKFLENFTPQKEKIRNTLVVIDEATIWFDVGTKDCNLKNALVRKRHSGNDYVLLFHSLSDVPKYIRKFSDFLVLFKTTDGEADTEKFAAQDKILSALEKLKLYPSNFGKHPTKHYKPFVIALR